MWMCLISLIAFLWQLLFRAFQCNHGSLSTLHTVIYDPFSLRGLWHNLPLCFSPQRQHSARQSYFSEALTGCELTQCNSTSSLVRPPLLWCCLNPRNAEKESGHHRSFLTWLFVPPEMQLFDFRCALLIELLSVLCFCWGCLQVGLYV